MDEAGADCAEWGGPERETPIQYTNTYIYPRYFVYRYIFYFVWVLLESFILAGSHLI